MEKVPEELPAQALAFIPEYDALHLGQAVAFCSPITWV